jgi:hypothetical protein
MSQSGVDIITGIERYGEATMGVVIYRRVINVYEIPRDILVECIGKGLQINRGDPDFPCLLEVAVGDGISYKEKTGHIGINAGDGLSIDETSKLNVNAGDGLKLVDNKLTVDLEVVTDETVDPTKTKTLTVQVDSHITFEAGKLTLKKNYQQFHLLKNCYGQMLDIEAGEALTDAEEVMIGGVCYGYGYGYGVAMKSMRESTREMPNFYKK